MIYVVTLTEILNRVLAYVAKNLNIPSIKNVESLFASYKPDEQRKEAAYGN